MRLDLGPDPCRLQRVHVVNVRLDRSGRFFVVMSNGEECTWDQWCDWGCVDLRLVTSDDEDPARDAVGRDGGGVGGVDG